MQWGIAYYRTPDGLVPGVEFLLSCPTKVAANFFAVLQAVRAAPPPAFSGGGKWEAMHGTMAGYYEIRGTRRAGKQLVDHLVADPPIG
jgi:hypothetical protein